MSENNLAARSDGLEGQVSGAQVVARALKTQVGDLPAAESPTEADGAAALSWKRESGGSGEVGRRDVCGRFSFFTASDGRAGMPASFLCFWPPPRT